MQNSDASCKVLIAAVEQDTTAAQENKEKDGCSVRWTDAEGSQKIQRPNANAKANGYESVRFFGWQKGAGAWLQHPAAADNSKTGRNPHTTLHTAVLHHHHHSDEKRHNAACRGHCHGTHMPLAAAAIHSYYKK
jgi:hypothetical protein